MTVIVIVIVVMIMIMIMIMIISESAVASMAGVYFRSPQYMYLAKESLWLPLDWTRIHRSLETETGTH